MRRYIDLIRQTFDFPTEDFSETDGNLNFQGVPLMEVVEEFGTPVKITYLPKISDNIQKAKRFFNNAMKKYGYEGSYQYCYCTKSSHFEFVISEALKNNIHLETSSGFDLAIIRRLYERNMIDKNMFIVCNGFKRDFYKQNISDLVNSGFQNCNSCAGSFRRVGFL